MSTAQVSESLQTITIKLLFFAKARELVGASSVARQVPPETLPSFLISEILPEAYPSLKPLLPHCALAVNLEYVPKDDKGNFEDCKPLAEGDEVAVIPPISGG